MDGWELRSSRRESELTAAQVARVVGTAESNITAYERGDKVPGPATLERIVAAVAAGSTSPIYTNGLVTAPQAASAIRGGIRHGWTSRELLRIMREHRSNASWVSRPIDVEVFFGRPATSGDRRLDALLAGSTEELAMRNGMVVPRWTQATRLKNDWFVTDDPAFHAYLLEYSPDPFRSRGVMVDPEALESV